MNFFRHLKEKNVLIKNAPVFEKLFETFVSTQSSDKTYSKGKLKDSNAPKKPKNAYMFFCMEVRDKIKEEHPEMKSSDILKEMGTMWKNLHIEDKKKYDILYQDEKERYNRELSVYKQTKNDQENSESKEEDSNEDSNEDSKKEESEEHSEYEPSEDDEGIFQPLDIRAKSNRAKSNRTAINKKKSKTLSDSERETKSDSDTKCETKCETKKKTRAKSGYNIFFSKKVKELREGNENMPLGEISKIVSKMWKELEDKSEYNEMAAMITSESDDNSSGAENKKSRRRKSKKPVN
jgi:hypothetical protein